MVSASSSSPPRTQKKTIKRSSPFFFFFSKSFFILIFITTTSTTITATSTQDELNARIYYPIRQGKPCVRLLNTQGVIGCGGTGHGTLRYLQDTAAVDRLVASVPDYWVVAVMMPSVLTKTTVNKLRNAGVKVAGALVLDASTSPPASYSPDSTFPQSQFAATTAQQSVVWNPNGDGLLYESIPFPVVQLLGTESTEAKARAERNEADETRGRFASHSADLEYEMYARGNSLQCLRDRLCFPIGGYSVWSTIEPVATNNAKPLVMATAAIDSAAMFHDLAVGADAEMSGLIALLGAYHAITKTTVNVQKFTGLSKHIVFAFFQGEAWGYVGSRNFVREVRSFTCKQAATGDGTGCADPVRPNLNFTHLGFANIHSVLHLSQVALNASLAMHRADTHTSTNELVSALQAVATQMATNGKTVRVVQPTNVNNGVPPSSFLSFKNQSAAIGGVVLADHAGVFKNPYYHSRFDTNEQVTAAIGGDVTLATRLCEVATLTARTLYTQAGGADNTFRDNTLTADCDMIGKLITCFTKDFHCQLAKDTITDWVKNNPTATPVTHYAGVYRILRSRSERVHGMAELVSGLLSSFLATGIPSGQVGQVRYHDAVDPSLSFDIKENIWRVIDNKESPVWTESNWGNDLGARMYRSENPAVAVTMLVVGMCITALAIVALHYLNQYLRRHFKMP